MRAPFIALMIILIVNLAVDYYIYLQVSRRCHNKLWKRLHVGMTSLLVLLMAGAISLPAREGDDSLLLGKMWLLFTFISASLPKIIATLFDLAASLPLLWHKPRIKKLTTAGIIIAATLCMGMWWGALYNRFNSTVNEIDLKITNLPSAFENFTIAQFSDLHVGSYGNDTTFVSRLVDEINALSPDVIVFTGDIVNRHSTEMQPFVAPLSRLKAKHGVYAILGNHDYGDYMNWNSPQEKQENMNLLYKLFHKANIKLLLNETAWLKSGNDSIALIGVENIGDPPFKTYGSLKKAYPDPNDSNIKILLSHNPQHWVDSISNSTDKNIALTLAGHTHAMQMEIAGITPAGMRYPTWGGLYSSPDGKSQLYVNIGIGTVALPMRLGATPEITMFSLLKNK